MEITCKWKALGDNLSHTYTTEAENLSVNDVEIIASGIMYELEWIPGSIEYEIWVDGDYFSRVEI